MVCYCGKYDVEGSEIGLLGVGVGWWMGVDWEVLCLVPVLFRDGNRSGSS